MQFYEYQHKVSRTMLPEARELRYLTLGLTGEAGEVANVVKKVYRNKYGEMGFSDRQRIIDELGDVMWYMAGIAQFLGVQLDEIAAYNIEKLRKRSEAGDLRHE